MVCIIVATIYNNTITFNYYNTRIKSGTCEGAILCTTEFRIPKYNLTWYNATGDIAVMVVPCPAGLTCPILAGAIGPGVGYVTSVKCLGMCGNQCAECGGVTGTFTVTEIVLS